jgi:hypothetical protein
MQYSKYFKFVEICSSGEHRENPKLSELYTALDVCLFSRSEITSCNQGVVKHYYALFYYALM